MAKIPSKNGDYILVNGVHWPTNTVPQQRKASSALALANRRSAAIEHWDGSDWEPTGTVIMCGS